MCGRGKRTVREGGGGRRKTRRKAGERQATYALDLIEVVPLHEARALRAARVVCVRRAAAEDIRGRVPVDITLYPLPEHGFDGSPHSRKLVVLLERRVHLRCAHHGIA